MSNKYTRALDKISRNYDIDMHSNTTFGWSVYIRSGIGSKWIVTGNDETLDAAIRKAVTAYEKVKK